MVFSSSEEKPIRRGQLYESAKSGTLELSISSSHPSSQSK